MIAVLTLTDVYPRCHKFPMYPSIRPLAAQLTMNSAPARFLHEYAHVKDGRERGP